MGEREGGKGREMEKKGKSCRLHRWMRGKGWRELARRDRERREFMGRERKGRKRERVMEKKRKIWLVT